MTQRTQISAEVIADSLNIATGDRLTTFRILCPRFILAEVNTHRALSRNFSSSRAIPAKKIRQRVLVDPFIPVSFGRNKAGMQAEEELAGWKLAIAKRLWLWARFPACAVHWTGEKVGLHKQLLNRILEPWMWAEGVISGTEWKNFFALRNHEDAQPEFRVLAEVMWDAMEASTPTELKPGMWHLPYAPDYGQMDLVKKISAARCARVSYYLRSGELSEVKADVMLCDRLAGSSPKHLSPFEHQAQALPTRERSGNFVGWKQFRKEFEDEASGDYNLKEPTHAAS